MAGTRDVADNGDVLLEAYCERFAGYGSADAAIWLVGLEEGGGEAWSDVVAHLDTWDRRGRPTLDRFRPDPVPPDHRWFGERPRLQPYWSRLSRLVLAVEGRPTDTTTVRAYQRDELAPDHGGAALLELLPLPSPSTGDWLHAAHSELPWLASRRAYRDHLLPARTRLLSGLLSVHRPAAVVFVGTSERDTWRQVADLDLPVAPEPPAALPGGSGAVGVLVQHPAAFGVSNAYCEEVGRTLRGVMRGSC